MDSLNEFQIKERLKRNAGLRSLNKIGHRIQWCRQVLELRQSDVAEAIGISLSGRENGVRSTHYEEFRDMADLYNKHWRAKFKSMRDMPEYEGVVMYKITFRWLMLGDMIE